MQGRNDDLWHTSLECEAWIRELSEVAKSLGEIGKEELTPKA